MTTIQRLVQATGSTREVAALMGVERNIARRWIRNNQIPPWAEKLGLRILGERPVKAFDARSNLFHKAMAHRRDGEIHQLTRR